MKNNKPTETGTTVGVPPQATGYDPLALQCADGSSMQKISDGVYLDAEGDRHVMAPEKLDTAALLEHAGKSPYHVRYAKRVGTSGIACGSRLLREVIKRGAMPQLMACIS